MTWSVQRRLLYFLVTLVVLALVGALLWWRYQPVPSCSDGVKNQDEVGIDCGGVCPQVCPTEIEAVKTVWSRIFAVDDGKYDLAVFLENPNPRHGIADAAYQIRVLDRDNILITTLDGRLFINPREQLVIFRNRLDTGLRVPVRAILSFPEAPIWQKMNSGAGVVAVAKKSFTNLPRPQLLATVTNSSLAPVYQLEVAAILSDRNGNAVAVSTTVVDELPAGATREIAFTWPRALPVEPATIDLYPHWRNG